MNKTGKKIFVLVGALLLITNVWSQAWTAGDNVTLNIPFFCLIETNYAPVVLTFATPAAGAPITSVSNSDLFVKISSIVPGNTNREITARISSGTVPAGTVITLVSAPCTTTNSGGELGTTVATPITLSGIDQNLVIGIETCYTGTGYNDGYQMTFTWGPDSPANYSQIESINTNIIVVFTITAHEAN